MKRKRLAACIVIASLFAAEGVFDAGGLVYATETGFLKSASGNAAEDAALSEEASSMEDMAFDGVLYEAAAPEEEELISNEALSGVSTASGVTEEMCKASYWNDRNRASGIGINERLITKEETARLNEEMLKEPKTFMHDLVNMDESYDADKLRESLVTGTVPQKKTLFVDQEEMNPEDYYKGIAGAIAATAYTGSGKNQYAVAVKRTTIRTIPVDSYIGYSAGDTDDEKTDSALLVNEPFLIRQKATVSGKDYYWGYSDNCTGWVDALDLAVCRDKEEWLDAWRTDVSGDDFIVVTANQIRLEPSLSMPELSEIKLTFATILKTVSDNDIPASIAERGPWNNYVVYLPLRDENGRYKKGVALISQHYEVSTGFLEMTQAELLRVAFNNLGDRYGWGGMLDSMDCSYYTRNVYRCFGLNLPRNTTWQPAMPGRKTDLSDPALTEEAKLAMIRRMPAGTLLYFSGHTMIYIGSDNKSGQETGYVISDTGSLADSPEGSAVRNMYSIVLNPLTVKRRNGNTWLKELTSAVLPISESRMEFVSKNVKGEGGLEPVSGNRVEAAEGQTYASSEDTLPLETFLQNTGNMYISFCNADDPDVDKLTATVVKGSRVTTKAAVSAVRLDKKAASYRINKTNGLATVTLNKSCTVSFDMADGKSYDVCFTVETPKAQNAAVKELLKEASSDTIALNVKQLFGTRIDGGTLTIISRKSNTAFIEENVLILKPKEKNTIKLSYKYLNKKYTMTITVK